MKEIQMLKDFFQWLESTQFKRGTWRMLGWLPLTQYLINQEHSLAYEFLMFNPICGPGLIGIFLGIWGLLCWTAGIVEWVKR